MRVAVVAALLLASSATADAGRGTGLLKYLPDDVAMGLVADVSHLRGSAALPQALDVLRHHSPRWAALADGGAQLDKLVDTFVVASTISGPHFTIVDGKVDTLLDRLKSAQPSKHAGITYYKLDDASELAIVDHHLIVAPAGAMEPLIDRARGKGPSAATSDKAAAFRAALADTSGTDVWGGIALDTSTRSQLSGYFGADVDWVAFAMALATGATLDLHIGCADEGSARTMAAAVQAKLDDPAFRDGIGRITGTTFISGLTIDRDRTAVRISGTIAADELALFSTSLNTWWP